MTVFKLHFGKVAGLAVLCGLAAGPGVARGQVTTIGFEPPTYTTGNLLGQDGWAKNAYYGPTLNGDVLVSSSNPLVGSQSLSYTQTAAGGFSDIHKPDVVFVPPGLQGTDLTLSYTIKASSNSFGSPFGGIFLQPVGGSGASPILAYINGGSITVNAGSVPLSQFFFLEDEPLRMTYEVDFDSSTMDFTVVNLVDNSQYTANYPFLAPYGSPTGPNGQYAVSVAAFLRGGNVQIDDIVLDVAEAPVETEYEWTATGSGNWNLPTNWTPAGLPGTANGIQRVTLGPAITAPQTIYNNATRNLNGLEFNNSNAYVVAGVGVLQFQADASGPTPVDPLINVVTGAHQIQLPVELIDDTTITVAAGASLDLNNQIDLNGNTLTTSGMVRINHSTIDGGTVNSTGALAASGASKIGGDLVSSGALLIGVDGNRADSFSVAGDATLSGVLDVQWSDASLPTGSFTVLTAGGKLDASGLALAADDARSFALGTDGNNLTLTFLGAAVPEPTSLGMFVLGLVVLAVRRPRSSVRTATFVAVTAATIGAAGSASAVSFNFENPPYTPGNLIGQDRWVTPGYVLADPFFGGVINGTVVVSGSSPLAGAQSVLYTQTIDPPSAGNTGAADVSRPFSVFSVNDGTTAVDLTASFQIQSNNNGVGNGSAGFFLGKGGGSPIIILITEANASNGTGNILVGDSGALPIAGSYVPNSVYEFNVGVDVDNFQYEVFARNVTAGTPAQQLTGSGPGGRFTFFGGIGFPSDGDGETFTWDTTMLLRSGTAKIDAITAVGEDFVEAAWGGGSGNWATNARWIPHIPPNATTGNAPIAVFGSRITAPETVFTNDTQTVNGMRFDNTNKYAIAGAGLVALKANTIGGSINPTINVVQGAHELQVPVSILNNTAVTVASGANLDFNNTITLGGNALTTSGAVDINFGVTGGGSISNSGTLGTAGTTPIAANLTSTGTLQVDLGPANTDRFNITGTATLSGLLDVVLEPGFTPVGSYTVLTSSGALNAAGLSLHPSDSSAFSLGVSGNSLVLTVGGSTSIPGDFDGNGIVNGADLVQWRGDFGAANDDSDADADGDSDGNDFLIWQRNVGQPGASLAAASIPEPASFVLASMMLAGAAAIGRRSRKA